MVSERKLPTLKNGYHKNQKVKDRRPHCPFESYQTVPTLDIT